MFFMLLQAVPPAVTAPDVTSTLIAGLLQFGAFGALTGWIVLKVIPSMQADAAAARADFKAALKDQQETFVEEMRLERESHGHEMEQLSAQVSHLIDQIATRKAG